MEKIQNPRQAKCHRNLQDLNGCVIFKLNYAEDQDTFLLPIIFVYSRWYIVWETISFDKINKVYDQKRVEQNCAVLRLISEQISGR